MSQQPNLFGEEPEPWRLARKGDPETSFEAASSLKAVRITKTRQAILDLLQEHPAGLSDEQIARAYQGPEASPSGLRTRRAELADAGLVVDTGRRARTRSGRRTILWALPRPEDPHTKEKTCPPSGSPPSSSA